MDPHPRTNAGIAEKSATGLVNAPRGHPHATEVGEEALTRAHPLVADAATVAIDGTTAARKSFAKVFALCARSAAIVRWTAQPSITDEVLPATTIADRLAVARLPDAEMMTITGIADRPLADTTRPAADSRAGPARRPLNINSVDTETLARLDARHPAACTDDAQENSMS